MFNKKLKAEIASLKADVMSKDAQIVKFEKMLKDMNDSYARREAQLLDQLAKLQLKEKEKPFFFTGHYGRITWTKEGENFLLAHKDMTAKELAERLGISQKAAGDKKYKLLKSLK